MKVTVQYFASLREARGLTSEVVEVESTTLGELYQTQSQKHHFTLSLDQVRIARNGDFAEPYATLEEGDQIVFLPPVAGG